MKPIINSGTLSLAFVFLSLTTPSPAGVLSLDGIGDWVELSNADGAIPSGNDPFTVEAWINPTSIPGGGGSGGQITFWGTQGPGGASNGFRLRGAGGTRHYFWGNDHDEDFGTDILPDTTGPGEDGWHHLAITYDQSETIWYWNGAPLGNPRSTAPGVNVVDANHRIGARLDAEYFDGFIDEIRIWNVARSGEDIAENFVKAIDPASAGLVAYYQFEGADYYKDATGLGHDGTPQGDSTIDPDQNAPVLKVTGWADTVAADEPVYWWRFENADVASGVENEGSTDGFDGTFGSGLTDADLVAGAPGTGQALQFTGPNADANSSKHVDFGAEIEELTNFRPPAVNKSTTVEYWVKTSQTGSGDNTWTNPSILGDESPGDGDFYWGNIANGGEFRMSTSDIREIRANSVTDGEWHHIMMVKVWDTVGPSTSAMYIDGGADAGGQTLTADTAGGNASYQDGDSGISRLGVTTAGGGGDLQFIGCIDELVIYDKALTEADAARHYQATLSDTDSDGLPDVYELSFDAIDSLDQLTADGDFDNDGLSDVDEFANGTDPTDDDTDDDGLLDGVETNTGVHVSAGDTGTDPKNPDTDGDDLLDSVETNTGTLIDANDTGTDPHNPDTDGDNFPDGFEVSEGTDPHDPDSKPGRLVVQPSFPPIEDPEVGEYEPDFNRMGLIMQENHYNAGTVFHNNTAQNYDRVALNPADFPPVRTKVELQPYFDHGNGGQVGNNRQYIDFGGDHFSIRVNGYVEILQPGNFTIHLGADDTNFFVMDLGAANGGTISTSHNCCPGNHTLSFTIAAPGLFPFDNVMVEEGGGDWGDLSISGPGINRVALGDTANGSPKVFPIIAGGTDSDGDGMSDFFEENNGLDKDDPSDAGEDPDDDGLTNLQEFEARTDPNDDDTDDDGLLDGVETNTGTFVDANDTGTDPTKADTDEDGLADGAEVTTHGTDPNKADTDGDGFSDGREISRGSNPLLDTSIPDSVVAHWHWDDVGAGQVDTWTDRILGIEATGLGNGPTKDDMGIAFDGQNDAFEVAANDNPLALQDTWTLTSVFKVELGASRRDPNNGGQFWANSMLVGRELPGGGRGDYGLAVNANNNMVAGWGQPDGGTVFQGPDLNDGEVHVASATFEVGVGISLYLDGEKVSETDNNGQAMEQETMYFGVNILNVGNDTAYYTGHIQQVLCHEEALPEAAVLALHANVFTPASFFFSIAGDGDNLVLTWESQDGQLFNVRSETDPSNGEPGTWPIHDGNSDIEATPPFNTLTIPRPDDPMRYFVVEAFPAPPEEVFGDDFESGQGDWTVGSEGAAGTAWELGEPGAGPAAANSPTNCFATNLAGNYEVNANVWLRSPAIDLSTAAGATLRYAEFRDIEAGFDVGSVAVLDAADDSVIAVIEDVVDGVTADWELVSSALPAEALGKIIKIEFRFVSDDIQNFPGWFIDDVSVTVP